MHLATSQLPGGGETPCFATICLLLGVCFQSPSVLQCSLKSSVTWTMHNLLKPHSLFRTSDEHKQNQAMHLSQQPANCITRSWSKMWINSSWQRTHRYGHKLHLAFGYFTSYFWDNVSMWYWRNLAPYSATSHTQRWVFRSFLSDWQSLNLSFQLGVSFSLPLQLLFFVGNVRNAGLLVGNISKEHRNSNHLPTTQKKSKYHWTPLNISRPWWIFHFTTFWHQVLFFHNLSTFSVS